jgi:uncharacterized protein (DUF1778 family)/GNAT superfamily N-acetyltransferase
MFVPEIRIVHIRDLLNMNTQPNSEVPEIEAEGKPAKVELLVSRDEAALIELAADLTGTALSQFVVDSACVRSKFILGNRSRIEIGHDSLAAVRKAVALPALGCPRLQTLFEDSGVNDPRIAIEKLNLGHNVSGFGCGHIELDNWLTRLALPSQFMGYADTYVAHTFGTVLGYYALAVERFAAPEFFAEKEAMPTQSISVMILLRLAIDEKHQKMGLGRVLIKDALLRFAGDAKNSGIQALLVQAKNDTVRDFYISCGFTPLPSEQPLLFIALNQFNRSEDFIL